MGYPTIGVTESEMFVFKFIKENEGKPIPSPLPQTVHSLAQKGLVQKGEVLKSSGAVRCYLTPLGKICIC